MSNIVYLRSGGTNPSGVNTLTGNTGGAVPPDGAQNINIIGAAGVDVAGNAGTNTLTVTAGATVATTYNEDVGSATPAANILVVTGGTLLNTAGAGNTVTINADAQVPGSFPTDAGTATPAANALSIVGAGGIATSGAGSTVTVTAGATLATTYTADAGSATPAANNLNILGGTGLSTAGAGSTITVNSDASVPLSFPTDSGTATPAANALTIAGGVGASTTGAGSTVTVNTTGGGFAWVEVTGTAQAIAVNTGYVANNAGSVTFTLPATALLGDTFKILGKGAGGWSIAQNAGQTIRMLGSATTTGAGGTLTPDENLAAIEITCVTANTDFLVTSSTGNFVLA